MHGQDWLTPKCAADASHVLPCLTIPFATILPPVIVIIGHIRSIMFMVWGIPSLPACETVPTLRSGRAGRPTKGALRGADARVTGTACWALASGLRMDIAGAAMVSISLAIKGCVAAR